MKFERKFKNLWLSKAMKMAIVSACISVMGASHSWAVEKQMNTANTYHVDQQNDKTVTGTVTDATGEPLIGVNISAKGTTAGTITDFDGKFSLRIPENAVLVVSYIGYKTQEVATVGRQTFAIRMVEDSELLDEVVIVGASFRKGDLTGAIGNVDGEALRERPVTNINEALQGRVAGVFINTSAKPSDDASIKIRGTNSINSGSDPIYVVDGLVMGNNQGGFNSINLNDVESIQVLKDASATALYGSRGANGVVVITTKKGKSGEGKVSYDGWVGFSKMTQRPETLTAGQLFDLRVDAFANGYMQENPNANRQQYIDENIMKGNDVFSEQEFETYRNGRNYDWLDQVMQTGIQQNHAVSFSGGSEKGSFYFSLGYSDIKGIIEKTTQKKYTGRFNSEYNIKPWLKVGTNTSFTHTKDVMPSDDVYNKALWANPLLDYAPYKDDRTRYQKDYLTLYYRMHAEGNDNDYNPFNSLEMDRDRIRNRLLSSNYLNINPMQGLNLRTTLAIDYAEQKWFEFTPDNIQESIRHYNGDARAKHERWTDMNWQWDNTITYETTIDDKHRINGLIGTSTTKKTYDYTKAQGDRFASNDLNYFDLGGAAAREKAELGSDFKNSTLVSFLARANYSYDNRYFLTATARYDGSSKFAKGHRWGLLPSFSAAWNISSEKFMSEQKVFDMLKLRAGYGVVGNQDIDDYVYATWYYSSVSNGQPAYTTSGLRGNPLITWEKQKQTNIGVDMAFLNSRIRLSVDGFFIRNEDLLLKHPLQTTSGYTEVWENIGEVKNRGLEITLGATVIETRDFTWDINANISFDKNEVTQLYGGVNEIYNGSDREKNIFLNESLNNIYTYKSGGIAQESNRDQWEGIQYSGKNVSPGDLFALDISGPDGKPDGIVDSYDRTVVGRKDPKFYGGFSTDLNYKGISLSAVFNYSYGAKKISSYYESLVNSTGTSMASVDLLDRWTPENTNTNIPRVIANTSSGYNRYSPSDLDTAIQNASYLRLTTLTLAYNLPASVLQKIHFSNLRVYATASNLFCITKYKGFDPETGDYGYPPSKQFVFGLNFSF